MSPALPQHVMAMAIIGMVACLLVATVYFLYKIQAMIYHLALFGVQFALFYYLATSFSTGRLSQIAATVWDAIQLLADELVRIVGTATRGSKEELLKAL